MKKKITNGGHFWNLPRSNLVTHQNILPDVDAGVQQDDDIGAHYHLPVLQLTQQAKTFILSFLS